MNPQEHFAEIDNYISQKFPDGIPPELKEIIERNIYRYPTDEFPKSNRSEEMATLPNTKYTVPVQFLELAKSLCRVNIYIADITGNCFPKNSMCIFFKDNRDIEQFMNIIFMDLPVSDKMHTKAFDDSLLDNWLSNIHLQPINKKINQNEQIYLINSLPYIKIPLSDYDWVLDRTKKFQQSGKNYEEMIKRRRTEDNNEDIILKRHDLN